MFCFYSDLAKAPVESLFIVCSTSLTKYYPLFVANPIKRKVYRYLSCLPDKMPPGVIAELYRRRWQIEKTYDNSKNSLFEQKAWGTSQETHKVQIYAIVSAMNFIRYFQEINLWDL